MEEQQPKTRPVKNADLHRVIVGLNEIGGLDIEDFFTNIHITKTIAELSEVEKAYQKSYQSLMKKYVEVDEKGGFKSEAGFYIFRSQEEKAEYEAAIEGLNDAISGSKIYGVKLSVLQKTKGVKAAMMAKCHELIIYDCEVGE